MAEEEPMAVADGFELFNRVKVQCIPMFMPNRGKVEEFIYREGSSMVENTSGKVSLH